MNIKTLVLLTFITLLGGSCSMLGISKINAYKMTVNGTPLFGKADKFITVMGLHPKSDGRQK
jgi:hypothetical protein